MDSSCYSFEAEFYDVQAELTKKYLISHYFNDQTSSIYDPKRKRVFLKRMRVGLTEKDFFLGNIVEIYGRQYKISKFGNQFTANKLGDQQQQYSFTFPLNNQLGEYLQILSTNNFVIKELDSFLMQKTPMVGITAIGKNVNRVIQKNIPHYESWSRGEDMHTSATLQNCTLCLIKPHAVRDGCHGKIINSIQQNGWKINAIRQLQFTTENAKEFLEIYHGVIEEFSPLVSELKSGKCLALEVSKQEENVVNNFRNFVGPRDPIVASKINNTSIRSAYGIDLVQNAVHTTDIPEDGVRDVEFAFHKMKPTKLES